MIIIIIFNNLETPVNENFIWNSGKAYNDKTAYMIIFISA